MATMGYLQTSQGLVNGQNLRGLEGCYWVGLLNVDVLQRDGVHGVSNASGSSDSMVP